MAIHISEDHGDLAEMLNKHNVGVIATASKGGLPHAATIYFFADNDFNIFFMTRKDTTKQQNLDSNPQAAIAIFEAAAQKTVQIAGKVQKVTEQKELEYINSKIQAITVNTTYRDIPPFNKLKAGEQIAYKLIPSNVRLATFYRPEQEREKGLFDIAIQDS